MEREFMAPGMSRGRKLALAAVTVWPLLWLGFTAAFMLFAVTRPDNSYRDEIITGFLLLALGHLLTVMLLLVVIALYFVHVFRNPRLDREKRWLWAALILFVNVFTMPVYWYFHVWHEPEVAGQALPAA